MDSRISAWMSGSCSDSMLMVPLVWKPPIRTSRAVGSEFPTQVQGAGKLVRLDSY